MGIIFEGKLGISPTRTKINDGEDVIPLVVMKDVDCVDLQEVSGVLCMWSRDRLVIFFPLGFSLEKRRFAKDSFYTTETHRDIILLE